MWVRLRSVFPSALAACLMPNHLHVIVEARSPAEMRRALAYAIRALARVTGTRGVWEPVPPPSPIPDRKHLLRQVRYVHLNPCRDGLTADPLSWPWSTHRGVLGAEMDPWVDARRLAQALGKPRRGFGEWLHAYVSADPSVAVAGTPPPRVHAVDGFAAASLVAMWRAVVAAGPLADRQTLRAGFIALCRTHGFDNAAWLARALGITRQHAGRLARRRNDALLRASLLCLGDGRLTQHAGSGSATSHFRLGTPPQSARLRSISEPETPL